MWRQEGVMSSPNNTLSNFSAHLGVQSQQDDAGPETTYTLLPTTKQGIDPRFEQQQSWINKTSSHSLIWAGSTFTGIPAGNVCFIVTHTLRGLLTLGWLYIKSTAQIN